MATDLKNTLRCLVVVRHPVGGIRTHVSGLLKSPEFADVSGTIVSIDVEEGRDLQRELAHTGFRFTFVDPSGRKMATTVLRLLLSERFDLVHAHGFTAGAVTTPLCWPIDLPTIVTAHDVFTSQQFTGLTGIAKRIAIARALTLATVIHCVTNDAAINMRQYLPEIPAGKIRVISHGVDAARFRDAQARDLRRELDLAEDALLIGFFGRFMAQKGFRLLLEALRLCLDRRSLPRTTYVVCLDNGGFVREDRLQAESMGLGSHLRFLPFTPFIGAELKGVDLVAMPSLWEASGLLAMETLIAGTPLVAASCVGLRETVAGTPAVTFSPGDVEGLANALTHALINQGRRQEFEAYRPEAEKRFSNSTSYRLIRKLYEEISK